MLYKDWLNEWIENYVKLSFKSRTYNRYREIVFQHIIPFLGNYKIEKLNLDILQKHINNMAKIGNLRTHKGLSANSINSIINVIQASLKKANNIGYLKLYIGDKIQRPKIQEKLITCFTLEEQKKIEYAVFNDSRTKMIGIVISLYTGLRIGELLCLEWEDIDFKIGILNVSKSCHDEKNSYGNYERVVDTPKTLSSYRQIPLPKKLIEILKKHKKISKSNFVIEGEKNLISVRSYQRSFELLLKKLNIPHKGFHSLRHTFATRAVECGMDAKTLSEILGHKSPNITLNRYVHSLFEHKKNMMNKIGKLL